MVMLTQPQTSYSFISVEHTRPRPSSLDSSSSSCLQRGESRLFFVQDLMNNDQGVPVVTECYMSQPVSGFFSW